MPTMARAYGVVKTHGFVGPVTIERRDPRPTTCSAAYRRNRDAGVPCRFVLDDPSI